MKKIILPVLFSFLFGTNFAQPVITVSPGSLNATVFCGDSISVPVLISNSGTSNLAWNVNIPSSFFDDFDPAVDASLWLDTTGGSANTLCGSFTGNALMFNGNTIRAAVTKDLNTVNTSSVSFYLKISNISGSCEDADSGEEIYLQYSTNGGGTWTNITTFNVDAYPNFTLINQTLPSGAKTASTRFRWNQPSFSGSCCDHWALDNVTINGANYISSSVTSGTTVPSGNSSVDILFNASGLNAGQYINSITITSNDPGNSSIVVPCTLNVTGQPLIVLSSNIINFGAQLVGSMKTDSVTISNNGCDSLIVSSIVSSSSNFTFSPANMSVPAYSSKKLYITFSPSAITTYTDSITVFNNSSDKVIYVNGSGAPAPVISVVPDSLNATLLCGDSTTTSFTIYNTGGVNLNYQIAGVGSGSGIPLDSVRVRLNQRYAEITALVPNMYAFTEGITGNNINDGGGDMYDGGNYLNTNLGTNLNYSDNIIISSAAMGTGGKYFTRKNTGLFAFAADVNAITYFEITGNLGADGSGNADTVSFTATKNGTIYRCFAKRVYNAGDPSINQLIILKNDMGLSSTYSANTGDGQHRVSGLSTQTRIYYLLYASASGGFVNNTVTNNIFNKFLDIIDPASQLPNWVSVSPAADTVATSDSSVVTVSFNANGLLAGTYIQNLIITSNDPVNDTIIVPCTLTVTGQANIVLSSNTINFGSLQVNDSQTDSITVSNSGCDTLIIAAITTSSGDFNATMGNYIIPPYSSQTLYVTFTPSAVMTYTDSLIIYNSDTNAVVYLNGTGTPSPVITITPNPVNDTIYGCNGSSVSVLSIINSGLANLNWNIFAPPSFYDDFDPATDASLWVDTTGGSSNNLCGSVSGNALMFNGNTTRNAITKDLNTVSTNSISFYLKISNISGSCEDADTGEEVMLQYSTNGGGTWTTIITFNVDAYPNFTLINQTLPAGAKTTSTRFKWYQPSHSGSCCDHWALDNVSIGSTGFITVSPTSGTTTPGNTSGVNLAFDGNGLMDGQYISYIMVVSNDPANDTVMVPCTLTVIGTPVMVLSDTCFYFGNVLQGDTVSQTLTVTNTGCADLTIGNIIAPSDFEASPASFVLSPDSSADVEVLFFPTGINTYSGNLLLFSNAGNQNICVNGTGVAAPDIAVSPSSITVNLLSCGDSAIWPLVISNSGAGTLDYNIGGGGGGIAEVLALTSGVDYAQEYTNTINAINQYFTNYNLTEINTTSAATLQTALNGKDVFLVAEQETGIASTFTGFASLLQSFVNNGGTVIFCGTDNNSGQHIFNSGLFTGSWITTTSSGTLNVLDNTHPITTGLSSTIPAQNTTNYMNITNGDKDELVSYTGNDVVTYRLQGSGKVIFIGYDFYSFDNNAARIIAQAVQWGGSGGGGSLPSWISVSPSSDTVSSGSSSSVTVTFNATGLNGGQYTGNITVTSNDPDESPVIIPCTLNVSFNPCVDFAVSNISVCTGSVTFADNTTNNPTSWNWSFGDGQTSNLQNPTHVYSSSGTYPVQLIACNSYGCDTMVQNVTVTFSSGPAAACSVSTTGYCCGMGIYNVTLNTINNNSTDGATGYQNFTCASSTNLTVGQTYSISVTTGTQYPENVRVWIDFNNNATFDVSELVFDSPNIMTNHTGNITIPMTAVQNQPLRMRVMSDYYLYTPSACTSVTYGQAEDYTVFVVPQATPPLADYNYFLPSACSSTVIFADSSDNNPTSWSWYFGDGDTSNLQNPSHTYLAVGNYTVQLTVCNAYGCDTYTQTISISNIGSVITACVPTTNSNCCGIGIFNVTFSTLNNSSGDGSEGYQDYTCFTGTSVIAGQSYNFSITTGTSVNENVRAWIDYNNNGVFESGEQIFASNNQLTSHSGIVVISTSSVTNIQLRMRVGSDYFSSPAPSPCTNANFGQFEDYAVTVLPSNVPPVANFTTAITDSCSGVVQFTDISTNNPTSWVWIFGEGNVSAQQNPTNTYDSSGTYTVTLIASNGFGSDTIVKTITVVSISASFTSSGNYEPGAIITFTANTPGATSWIWQFGDGNIATVQNPLHSFPAAGTYTVVLTATASNGCSVQYSQNIVIIPTGISTAGNGNLGFEVYPNPNDGIFRLQIINYKLQKEKTEIKIYNVLGEIVYSSVIADTRHDLSIPIAMPRQSGIYYIQLSSEKGVVTKKVVVE